MTTPNHSLSFGIKTSPMSTTYADILRVWREADAIPAIEHAWLWDHFLPLFRDLSEPVHEGWTLLAALAGQTKRLRLGLIVTSNAVRPPAVLAKMAATVDVISSGRLVFGIGVGGTRQPANVDNPAVREYAAYGLPLVSPADGIARLAEACTIVRRLWTGEAFDFEGRYYHLGGAICRPTPTQRPGPPLMIGGWGTRTLRVVAEHADIWNVPGPPHATIQQLAGRTRVLDEHCAAIGRDPGEITRSTQIIVSYDDPGSTRGAIRQLIDVGFMHIVLGLPTPYPEGVAGWAAAELVTPLAGEAPDA
jgi:alkanesulfonate monooxygenase SsuD/methylene tetrahydromethanopterin reductase-like flavin-dependent oxidoreductase (luciferase family)